MSSSVVKSLALEEEMPTEEAPADDFNMRLTELEKKIEKIITILDKKEDDMPPLEAKTDTKTSIDLDSFTSAISENIATAISTGVAKGLASLGHAPLSQKETTEALTDEQIKATFEKLQGIEKAKFFRAHQTILDK